MEMMDIDIETIGKINVQCNNITNIKWLEKTDTHSFWYEMSMYRDSSDTIPFFELSEFALKLLVLPWSNVEVERVFSQMNIIKQKPAIRWVQNCWILYLQLNLA
ncbi:Gustatory receptor [Aphis craccivora]|uniref:Gustatory receptor n=1 Tax=Aphis craccivora TaxID=307492 RepID=A0A6G0YWJ2_APHCR|nr:Gustatory receptor [Aphis craccivora]